MAIEWGGNISWDETVLKVEESSNDAYHEQKESSESNEDTLHEVLSSIAVDIWVEVVDAVPFCVDLTSVHSNEQLEQR